MGIGLLLMVNGALLAGAFLAIEVAFRRSGIPFRAEWTPSETAIARFDSVLGWSYVPDRSVTQAIGDTTWDIHFDANGIRVPCQGCVLSDTTPSVLFIGDSFVMGHGLPYEQTFVGRIAGTSGFPFQAVNLGVQAYGTDQSYLALTRYLHRFNTKAVVYTFIVLHVQRNGIYDQRMLSPRARYVGTKPRFTLDRHGNLQLDRLPVTYDRYHTSYLRDFVTMRAGPLVGAFPPFPERLTARLIEAMRDSCAAAGVPFMVFHWRWKPTDYGALFEGLDVDRIDVLEGAPREWDKMFIPGDGHPDAAASAHAADLLLRHFRARGLMESGV